MSKQSKARRAAERASMHASLVSTVHTRVSTARSVQDLWRTFADMVLIPRGIKPGDDVSDVALVWFRRSFYAGASSMLDLMTKVAPDAVSEDEGVAMLQRWSEELTTYAKDLA